ncbi:universal stress protein [Ilumatobacter sp.]|uniref:universal stress protein n=1 Tax=Ilumatobacter sp. TaxID=1967498 RepID=UPI003B51A1CC
MLDSTHRPLGSRRGPDGDDLQPPPTRGLVLLTTDTGWRAGCSVREVVRGFGPAFGYVLLHVHSEPAVITTGASADAALVALPPPPVDTVELAAADVVNALASELRERFAVTVDVRFERGPVAATICRTAHELGAVVIGVGATARLHRRLLRRTVADDVQRHAPCAVAVHSVG